MQIDNNLCFDTLKKLCDIKTASGFEDRMIKKIKEIILSKIESSKVSIKEDDFNNLFVTLNEGFDDKILIDAHVDNIALTVTDVLDNGFLKVAAMGGVDRRVLMSSNMYVMAKDGDLPCTVSLTPPHLAKDSGKIASFDEIFVDTALEDSQCKEKVQKGDAIVYLNPLEKLSESVVTASGLDNKASVAALLLALFQLSEKKLEKSITFMFSAQEEVGCRGARLGAFASNAKKAITVDVSFASQIGVPKEKSGELGKGAMIGFSPFLSRKMSEKMTKIAKDNNLPYQVEIMGSDTSTNADEIANTKDGIPTTLLSIPLRYMHTPVETVHLDDIINTAKLISLYCSKD